MKTVTIKDLKKLRIKSKNQTEKNTYMMLIDLTEKLAKENNDTNLDKYLPNAIKKYQKLLEESVNPNETEVNIIADLADKILPKMLNEEETKKVLDTIIKENCKEVSKKCFGMIMKSLPENVDKKLASKLLKEIL